MHCMKCGREIQEKQVFCPDCLAHMSENPVKAGTAVKLPLRATDANVLKKRYLRKRRERSEEEQLLHQRLVIRRLTLALIGASLLILAAAFLLFWMFKIGNVVDVPDLLP